MTKLLLIVTLLLSAMVLSGCGLREQIISNRCHSVAIIQDGGRGNDIIDYNVYKDCVNMYLPTTHNQDE